MRDNLRKSTSRYCTGFVNLEQKKRAVALSIDAGVQYLKNASGGAVGVATPEDIRFLRMLAPKQIRVKASGGIKTVQQVRDLIAAGADLVGTSSGVRIMRELVPIAAPVPEQITNY